MRVGETLRRLSGARRSKAPQRFSSAVAPWSVPVHRPAPVTVWLWDGGACPHYVDFVSGYPGVTAYHTPMWRDALVAAGAGQPLYLVALRNEDPVGVLPLFQTAGPQGPRLVSLPYTPAAGVLTRDAEAAQRLSDRAARLARARGADGVYLREFVAATPGRTDATGHLRLPLEALACSTAAVAGSSATRCVSAFAHRGGGWPASLLGPTPILARSLATAGAGVVCSTVSDPGGDSSCAVLWFAYRHTAHVLAVTGAASPPALRALLAHVQEQARARGATHIDLPVSEPLRDVLEAALPRAELSRQRREITAADAGFAPACASPCIGTPEGL